MMQPRWKSLTGPEKLNKELPYDLAISLLLCIKKNGNQELEQIYIHSCSYMSVSNSQKVEATQMFITDKWINEMLQHR